MKAWLVLAHTESGDDYQEIFDYPITEEEAYAHFYSLMPDEYSDEIDGYNYIYLKIKEINTLSKVPHELIHQYRNRFKDK